MTGNQVTARRIYDAALAFVPEDGTADAAAQRATIMRDDAFTFTRQGIGTRHESDFREARDRLRQSLAVTALLVAEPYNAKFRDQGPHGAPKKARRELLSTHASTLELLARNATAEEVVVGFSGASVADHLHGWAHDYAARGTNGYVRVSNAMNNAREERIRGSKRLPHVAVALGRAMYGVAWTAVFDRANFVPAVGTVVHRLCGLATPAAARRSVRARP